MCACNLHLEMRSSVYDVLMSPRGVRFRDLVGVRDLEVEFVLCLLDEMIGAWVFIVLEASKRIRPSKVAVRCITDRRTCLSERFRKRKRSANVAGNLSELCFEIVVAVESDVVKPVRILWLAEKRRDAGDGRGQSAKRLEMLEPYFPRLL
jgi:hypothetical protein